LLDAQPLNGLAGDLRYYLEVLVELQDREPSQLGGRCDDQVRWSSFDGQNVMAARDAALLALRRDDLPGDWVLITS
jgi:hypothetical protein